MTLKTLGNINGVEILTDEPMHKHTSFGVGGKADYFIKINSLSALNTVVYYFKTKRLPFKIIGNGTNLLVSDTGFRGAIISTANLSDIFFDNGKIKAMSGASMQKLISFALVNSLSGLECFAGIPATVGGAVVMNAGAFGHTISERIETVETVKDGKIIRYDKDCCKFQYRKSRFKNKNQPIVSATFSLELSDEKTIKDEVKRITELRKFLHPAGKTCGSVFKNLDKATAGQLIDGLGLKGFGVGGVSVSTKHANFIVNDGTGTATEIATLICLIKTKVKNAFGVDLQEEVEYIGEF